ncbi:hypothetical protein AGENTSMITH_192 [Bacillus phage vB_BspM_AgentSmith]|nr:hypothetical protein AGENTSMITH_192 [Bacillus phage vB_BspM_AgentSmith]
MEDYYRINLEVNNKENKKLFVESCEFTQNTSTLTIDNLSGLLESLRFLKDKFKLWMKEDTDSNCDEFTIDKFLDPVIKTLYFDGCNKPNELHVMQRVSVDLYVHIYIDKLIK